jgi:hypothetical protein
MEMVRQAEVDRLKFRPLQQIFEGDGRESDGIGLGKFRRSRQIPAQNRYDLHSLQTGIHLGPKFCNKPRAQHCHPNIPAHSRTSHLGLRPFPGATFDGFVKSCHSRAGGNPGSTSLLERRNFYSYKKTGKKL